MLWLKRNSWKAYIAFAGLLLLMVLMVWVPVSADADDGVSGLAVSGPVQATPTVDLTVTALAKEQLSLQVQQLRQSNDRGVSVWLWSNAAAIVASLLSTLVIVGGALIGFWQWRMNRNDIRTKESNDRKEAQEKELRAQAEERFQASVAALGGEKESVQVGGAILLRSFLNDDDKEIYRRYYAQIFDLAVAYLRPSNTSLLTEDSVRIPLALEDPPAPLPLTPLRQALIVVYKEVFPLVRDETSQSLDATGIQLDHADLTGADLNRARMPYSSLRKADFAFALLQKVYLRGSHLERAQFVGAQLKEANFTIAHLKGANFNGAHLEEANLGGSHLEGAYFREAHLGGAILGNAYLTGADLSGADLSGANLDGADLRNANLQKADLTNAKLSEAVLYEANLSGAKLFGADLRESQLYKANISEANLLLADLREVVGLSKKRLNAYKAKGAIIDDDIDETTPTISHQTPVSLPASSKSNDEQIPSTSITQESTSPTNSDGSSTTSSQPSVES